MAGRNNASIPVAGDCEGEEGEVRAETVVVVRVRRVKVARDPEEVNFILGLVDGSARNEKYE